MSRALLVRFSSHETERETKRTLEQRLQKSKDSINEFIFELETLNGRLIHIIFGAGND